MHPILCNNIIITKLFFVVHYLSDTTGVDIKNLEVEDYLLLKGSDSDSSDFMYHEKMRPDVLMEFWNITGEGVNEDFPQDLSNVPTVDVSETSRIIASARTIVRWMLIFLCLWSSFCSLSDNAFEALHAFLRAVFDSLGTIFPIVERFGMLLPKIPPFASETTWT